MRLFAKRLKAAPHAGNHAAYEYAVDPFGRNEYSTPAGVVIDGFVYTLEGEPPVAHGNWGGFRGNGQR